MGKKRHSQTVLGVLMILVLLIGMIPGVALAADGDRLGGLEFVASTDSTIITGETTNINVKLYQYEDNLDTFSGAATVSIQDAKENATYYSITGSQGNYTIQNVTIDTPGEYTLRVIAASPSKGTAMGTLKVVNAVPTVTGSLFIDTNNTMTVKLADTDGVALPRKALTIDGSMVGATAQSVTTLSDGSITFQITPSKYGTVNIIHSGHVIGTIPVVPAYTQGDRIGAAAEDNVALAIEIAKSGWTEGTKTVILARDDQFSDTMAAVPLSKILNAPILMTASAQLDDRTLAEMRNMGAANVYIVGGTVAVSQGIQDSLSSAFTVTRVAGEQGYDTAALISSYVGMGDKHTVFIANGNAIPDAIAGSAFAAEQRSPILLTDRDQLPSSTIKAMEDLKVTNVVLLGGTAVIGTQVENELSTNYAVKRWGGNDRYDTQNIIFENLFNSTQTTPRSPLYFTSGLVRQDDVSSGKPNADALLTAALAAKNGGFVAMVSQNELPTSLNFFLLFNKGYITKAAVVGNRSSVSPNLEQQIHELLNR